MSILDKQVLHLQELPEYPEATILCKLNQGQFVQLSAGHVIDSFSPHKLFTVLMDPFLQLKTQDMSMQTFFLLLLCLVYLRTFSHRRFNRSLATFNLACNANVKECHNMHFSGTCFQTLVKFIVGITDTRTVRCYPSALHIFCIELNPTIDPPPRKLCIRLQPFDIFKNGVENSSCFNQNYNANHLARMLIYITKIQELSGTLKTGTFLFQHQLLAEERAHIIIASELLLIQQTNSLELFALQMSLP